MNDFNEIYLYTQKIASLMKTFRDIFSGKRVQTNKKGGIVKMPPLAESMENY